jgi:hypothetical protein
MQIGQEGGMFGISQESVVDQGGVNSFQRRSFGFIQQANRSSTAERGSGYDFQTPVKPLKIRPNSTTKVRRNNYN